MGAVPNLLLLQIDRELLDLPEQKARERRACIGVPGRSVKRLLKVNEPVGDGGWTTFRRSQRRSAPHLHRVASLQPRQRIGDLRHARCRSPWPCSAAIRAAGSRRSETSAACSENCAVDGMPGRPRTSDAEPLNWAAAGATVRRVSPIRSSLTSGRRDRPLVTGGKRPRRRVLRSERAGGDAAAFGQRGHRDERLPEIASAVRTRDRGWSRIDGRFAR